MGRILVVTSKMENDAENKLLQNGLPKIVIVRQESKSKPRTPVLSVVDILLSVFVVTPLVVLSWRGLWGYMDNHMDYFPIFPCFIIGRSVKIII